MPTCRPSLAHYFAGPRAVARLPANDVPRPRSCVTTWINWDWEKAWKQSTPVVESLASQARTRKEKRPKRFSAALFIRLA